MYDSAIDILINATDKASGPIKQVESSLGGMNSTATESKGVFSGLGSVLQTGLAVAATGAVAAIGGLAYAFSDSASIARQHIEVQNQLNAVLKSTGGAAGVTADMANKLATSLEGVTNFDDEAVASGESLLLTFTGIGKDVFPRATETMLDMSQALGQDMKSSAVQLGKALNDPIQGITALSRVGVSFTEQQKDQIKTMVEAGNTAGAQGLILDELAKEFGGSAKAMAEPGKQLANMWDDLKETVGMFIIPIMDDLAKRAMPLVAAASDYLTGLLAIFNDNLSKGGSYADAFGAVLKDILPIIKDWTAALWKWIVDSVPVVLHTLGEWGSTLATWFVKALPGFLSTFLEWETALYQWIDNALPQAIEAIAGFVRGLRGEGDSTGGSAFGSMASGWAGKLWKWITDELIPAVGPAFFKFVDTMAKLGRDLLGALGDLAIELGKTLWKWIVDITPVALKALADWGGALWGWIKQNAPTWRDYLAEWAGMAWTWLRDTAIPAALEQLAKWGVALWGWVKDNAPTWRQNLIKWQEAAWQWVLDSIPIVLQKLGEWGKEIIDWVRTSWPGWRDSLLEAGRNVIQGFVDGIKKRWSELVDSIASIPRDFVDNLKYDLGIHSPSSVMYDIGTNVSQGLVDGIASYASQFEESGRSISNGVVAGLKSQVDVIAAQVKSAMELANATLQGEIDTMNRQAAVKAQQSYLAAVAAVSSPANIAAALKAAGVDTSKVTGYGPNGELILAGAGNKLPAGFLPPPPPTSSPDAVATTQGITKTLADALGIVKGIVPVVTQTATLLGGLNLSVTDNNPADTKLRETINNAVTSTFSGISSIFSSDKLATLFSGQDYNMQTALASLMKSIGGTLSHAADTAGRVVDTAGFKDVMNGLLASLTATITGAANGSTFAGDADVQKWFSGLVKSLTTTIKAGITAESSATKVTDPLSDFVKGVSAFLKDTLTKAQTVIQTDAISQNSALINGTLGSYLGSATHQKIVALGSSLKGIQQSFADILGVSVNDLNVTNADSPQLLDRIKSVIKNTNGDTSFDAIQSLLQSAVNFRSGANSTGINYYADVLPTDPRLTGQAAAGNTTNYNITLQGSNNANADVLSLVQMLGTLQGSATP